MIEMEDLKRGVKKYATPLYVYDLDAVEETLTAFRLKFWDTADLCFAMKANPFLTGKIGKIRTTGSKSVQWENTESAGCLVSLRKNF